MNSRDIEKLQPGQVLWDRDLRDSVKGLHVRAFESKVCFYVYYRTASGRERRPKLGQYPTMSVQEARELAKSILLRAAWGEDPSVDKQSLREQVNMQRLFELTWEQHWSAERFQKSGWASEARRNWEKTLSPTFAKMKLSEVTSKVVRAWHSSLKDTPYQANRSLATLSKMLSFAEELELKPPGTNPCRIVKPFSERKRSRFASEAELKIIGRILEREKEKFHREVTFILAMIHSGARPEFLANARSSDLKLVAVRGEVFGVIHGPGKSTEESGNLESIIVPGFVLNGVRSRLEDPNAKIFGPIPYQFWYRVRREAGCTDIRIRDLRRTYATAAVSADISLSKVGEILNHQSVETTKTYGKVMDGAK